jgi:hypothetical protein
VEQGPNRPPESDSGGTEAGVDDAEEGDARRRNVGDQQEPTTALWRGAAGSEQEAEEAGDEDSEDLRKAFGSILDQPFWSFGPPSSKIARRSKRTTQSCRQTAELRVSREQAIVTCWARRETADSLAQCLPIRPQRH